MYKMPTHIFISGLLTMDMLAVGTYSAVCSEMFTLSAAACSPAVVPRETLLASLIGTMGVHVDGGKFEIFHKNCTLKYLHSSLYT